MELRWRWTSSQPIWRECHDHVFLFLFPLLVCECVDHSRPPNSYAMSCSSSLLFSAKFETSTTCSLWAAAVADVAVSFAAGNLALVNSQISSVFSLRKDGFMKPTRNRNSVSCGTCIDPKRRSCTRCGSSCPDSWPRVRQFYCQPRDWSSRGFIRVVRPEPIKIGHPGNVCPILNLSPISLSSHLRHQLLVRKRHRRTTRIQIRHLPLNRSPLPSTWCTFHILPLRPHRLWSHTLRLPSSWSPLRLKSNNLKYPSLVMIIKLRRWVKVEQLTNLEGLDLRPWRPGICQAVKSFSRTVNRVTNHSLPWPCFFLSYCSFGIANLFGSAWPPPGQIYVGSCSSGAHCLLCRDSQRKVINARGQFEIPAEGRRVFHDQERQGLASLHTVL